MKVEERAFNHLITISTKYKFLNEVIKKNGIVSIPSNSFELFEFMTRLIIKQQLSNKVAEAIWEKVMIMTNNDLLNFMKSANQQLILDCGVSKRKFEAIYRLKKEYDTNLLEKIYSSDIEDVKNYIISLYGFGEWSASMVCLFYLKNENIWSNNDATLTKAIKLLNLDTNFIERCSPYKSFLALHLWKAIDRKHLM